MAQKETPDQWDATKSQEINPWLYMVYYFMTKETRTRIFNEERTVSPINSVEQTCKTVKPISYTTYRNQLNMHWILERKTSNQRTPTENITSNFLNITLGDFFNLTSKAKGMKAKTNKGNYIKLLCIAKLMGENIYKSCIWLTD